MINRTLHVLLERASRVEKIFYSFSTLTREIFFNIGSPRDHVIFSIYTFYSSRFIEKMKELLSYCISYFSNYSMSSRKSM